MRAAYPRGGDIAIAFLGLKTPKDSRQDQKYTSFKSQYDPQRQKIKTLAEKFDAPKRVEIKELELGLEKLLEFKDLKETKLKNYLCKEIAFIVKDLQLIYNMTN